MLKSLFLHGFKGQNHPSTQAAKQNLMIVRNNRLNQLWMQIVAEEVLRLEEEKKQGKVSQ